MLEFTRRDLRWCQGNMQYFRLLGMTGLQPMSRFQLVWAISMFIGIPAWTVIIALGAIKPLDGEPTALFPSGSALGLYGAFMFMYLAPKLAGFLDIAMTRGGLARYGGGLRFAGGRRDGALVLVPHLRGRHRPHEPVHDRPAVRPRGRVERAGARRPCALVGRRPRGACGRRLLFGLVLLAFALALAPGADPLVAAVDGRIFPRHSVCRGDGRSPARRRDGAHRPVRHP